MLNDRIIQTTCPYCGVGCGVDAGMGTNAEGRTDLIAVSGSAGHPANRGRLCVKGSALHEALGSRHRLLHPAIGGERVDWDHALDTVAQRFARIVDEHGPGAVAFYLSGQLLTEDYYVANKLMKGFIGSSNVDTNSRLCMSSAVAGYKRAFGEDVVPCCYDDLDECELLVLTGSNAAWTHPVLYQRMVAARKRNPRMRVVVIDPRQTATADLADLHLPLAPGSDGFLFAGLQHWLWREGLVDMSYVDACCDGWPGLRESLAPYTPECVARHCRLPLAQLEKFYRLFASTERTLTFYSQGINQSASGTDKASAIINCHLLTGRIGRPGMGPFSITGQPNAMGGREVGGLANQLAAHMDFVPDDMDRVRRFWQAPRLAEKPGLKAVDMFDAIARGDIKAVWIMGTNPAVSLPDTTGVRQALDACEFVVVSDCVEHTDTMDYADVVLPATGWSEKDGTVTNSERVISRQRALLPPSGQARHDWQIICDVACRMGFGEAFRYTGPHDIFVEHAALSAFENHGERLFNLGALGTLTQPQYDALQPVRWPCVAGRPDAGKRLFGDGRFSTPSGKAMLQTVTPVLPDVCDATQYPCRLNTGRLRDQWHTMTRTGLVPRLMNHCPSPACAIHPDTARAHDLDEDDLVAVENARGRIVVPVHLDRHQAPGDVFIPMHWNNRYAANAVVNRLIAPRVDPHSGQPESKYANVRLERVDIGQWTCLLSTSALAESILAGVDYWDRRIIKEGWLYRLAHATRMTSVALKRLLPGIPDMQWIEYEDSASSVLRLSGLAGVKCQVMLFAAPALTDLPDPAGLEAVFRAHADSDPWQLLSGRLDNGPGKGNIVCSCHQVGENEILDAISEGAADERALGRRLKCGTGCGSCLPELRQYLTRAQVRDPALQSG